MESLRRSSLCIWAFTGSALAGGQLQGTAPRSGADNAFCCSIHQRASLQQHPLPTFLPSHCSPTCVTLCSVLYGHEHSPQLHLLSLSVSIWQLLLLYNEATPARYGPDRPTFLGDFTAPPPYLSGEFPGASPNPGSLLCS